MCIVIMKTIMTHPSSNRICTHQPEKVPKQIVKKRGDNFSPLSNVSQVKHHLKVRTEYTRSDTSSIDTQDLDLETPVFGKKKAEVRKIQN